MAYIVTLADQQFKVDIREYVAKEGGEHYKVAIDKRILDVSISVVDQTGQMSMIVNKRSYDVDVQVENEELVVVIDGQTCRAKIEDEAKRTVARGKDKEHTGEVSVKAPMPGMVVAIEVKLGEEVGTGKGLAILEAMKMQNELRASRAGIIKAIKVKPGDKVNGGDVLMVIG